MHLHRPQRSGPGHVEADRYKNVRLLILVGRTIPGPEAVEAIAGALTGVDPEKAADASNGTQWYQREVRGIRLADGTGAAVGTDRHPDPTAEAVRFQICEGEVMQALGRGRGVNRTAATPLDIDILADVCLPLAVNEVIQWQEPSPVVEMLAEGIMLTSPADMVKAWPEVWPNTQAADRTLGALIRECTGAWASTGTFSLRIYYQARCTRARAVRYQLAGSGMKARTAFVDPEVLPDPRAWLERRFGPLAKFQVEEDEAQVQPKGAAM